MRRRRRRRVRKCRRTRTAPYHPSPYPETHATLCGIALRGRWTNVYFCYVENFMPTGVNHVCKVFPPSRAPRLAPVAHLHADEHHRRRYRSRAQTSSEVAFRVRRHLRLRGESRVRHLNPFFLHPPQICSPTTTARLPPRRKGSTSKVR